MIVRSRRYKQALTGAKVHDASMQTSRLGGVAQQGAKPKRTSGTLGDAVLGKWKVMQPMVDALDVHPHVRNLVANYAVVAAYQAGAELLVPRGTRLKEVSLSRMMAERAVLESGELKTPRKLDEALTKMREERRKAQREGKAKKTSRAVQFCREGLAGLLKELAIMEEDEDGPEEPPDWQYHSVSEIVDPPTLESRERTLPHWAKGLKNLRGLIEFSRSHFYAIVGVKGPGGDTVVGEAVMDTGGSRSLIDKDTAAQFGLQVHVGDAGYFWGPGNSVEPYYGKVEGPVVL